MTIKKKVKKRKLCKWCNKLYYRNTKYSDKQWNKTKYCSHKCAGEAKKIKDEYKDKCERHARTKLGLLKQGSLESRAKISRLTKEAMQKPEVQKKIRKKRKPQTLERRIKQSNLLAGKMPKNMFYQQNQKFPNVKRGYYDINGEEIYFRSKWEANYSLYLDFLKNRGVIKDWEFEAKTFMFEKIKLGTRSYTPDFEVTNPDDTIEYHEVKGYMTSKCKTKLKRMAKYHPDVKLVLIKQEEYYQIKKDIGTLIDFY